MGQRETDEWLNEDEFRKKREAFLEDIRGDEPQNEQMDAQILTFIESLEVKQLDNNDRAGMRERLEVSLAAPGVKRVWFRWVAAAVLLVGILGAAWVFTNRTTDSVMMAYVNNLEVPETGNNTLLILGNKKKITIQDENSNIAYQPDEKNIRINKDQQVETISDSLTQGYHTVIVPYGKRSELILSDGTKVWLNSGTKLVYPASFKTARREVFLQGEAVFDVTHLDNSSFFVKTNDFSIKVLGTIFNVSAYADDKYSSAVLAQGHIEISSGKGLFSHKVMDMSPGTMAVYDPQERSFQASAVDPGDYLSWRNGFLSLHSEYMINILRKLSRYYNIAIDLNDQSLGHERFTGNLDLRNSPVEVLEIISRMVPLSVQESDGKLIINTK